MPRVNNEDMVVIRMGIDALLQWTRITEMWWQVREDESNTRDHQQLINAIFATRRKLFADRSPADSQMTHALVVAEGLREAARQCNEGQTALYARLVGAADVIERLCQTNKVRP